jgi:hypothetical protein
MVRSGGAALHPPSPRAAGAGRARAACPLRPQADGARHAGKRRQASPTAGGGSTSRSPLMEIREGGGRSLRRASGKSPGDLERSRLARGIRDWYGKFLSLCFVFCVLPLPLVCLVLVAGFHFLDLHLKDLVDSSICWCLNSLLVRLWFYFRGQF